MSKLVFIGDLEPYKEQVQGAYKKQYHRLLVEADRYAAYELPAIHPKESTTYMGVAIMNLALAYRLSEEERYLLEAKRFIRAVLAWEEWGNAHLVNVDLSASWILFGLSLGYDWLKPFLTAEEKERIVSKLKHHAGIMYQYRRDTYGHGWSTNYYQNHNWINMTGLAAAGYVLLAEEQAEDRVAARVAGQAVDQAAGQYIAEARDNFVRVFAFLADDGSNYEGVSYWRYGGMWLFVYAHLLKVQEGIDYFATSNYLRNTFYYRLYQSCGDLQQQQNFGDCHDRYSGHTPCVYYKAAAEYRDGFAQKFGNLVLDEFLEIEAAESKIKPGILPEAGFEFLWYDPAVPEQELTDLPTVKYFEDLGLLAIRESWARDSKVLSIKCGYPGGRKQWQNSFRLYREEQIDSLALSHHHPDNLSYIFARGSEFLTCEDGYNRNIMPDHHNVILVDGRYTDAVGVNDVYTDSAWMRLEKNPDDPTLSCYKGEVTHFETDGQVVIYKGETAGIYPDELQMTEVSRLLFSDQLAFFIFIDVCKSELPHQYRIISNTDMEARPQSDGSYLYPLKSGCIKYTVFSDNEIKAVQYQQEVVSVMTTQEPDKVCKSSINTLAFETAGRVKKQMFIQCFTFESEPVRLQLEQGSLLVIRGEKRYRLEWQVDQASQRITVTDADGTEKTYLIQ